METYTYASLITNKIYIIHTLIQIAPSTPSTNVIVVGDTHGQFHDVCHMFEVAKPPSSDRIYIFNGDFVDRGAWGIETLILFCCWKLALPHRAFLLRGNHETVTCSILYGFKGELEAKYGKSGWKSVFAACKKLFAALPLAAVVNKQTLVLHGGLFRKQPTRSTGKAKRKRDELVLGSLVDLKKASKGGLDPGGLGAARLATDVLWSDPTKTPGFLENDARGVGMTFGPEITEQFLRENELALVLRSHEGPDAREDREGMGNMLQGWTEDHVTPAGRLMTVFSAPDYPQFMADDALRYKNKGAVAVLSAPEYNTPAMTQYEAVLPRPEAKPYYDLYVNDSDEELEVVPSTVSGMTDVREEHDIVVGKREEEGEGEGEVKSKVQEDVVEKTRKMEEVEEEKEEAGEGKEVKVDEKVEGAPGPSVASPAVNRIPVVSPLPSLLPSSPRTGPPAYDTPRSRARGSTPTKWHHPHTN